MNVTATTTCSEALLASPVGQTAAWAEKTSVTGSSLAALCREASRERIKARRLGWVTLREKLYQEYKKCSTHLPRKLATRALSRAAAPP